MITILLEQKQNISIIENHSEPSVVALTFFSLKRAVHSAWPNWFRWESCRTDLLETKSNSEISDPTTLQAWSKADGDVTETPPPIQVGISETSPDGLDLICSALLHPILPSCVLNIFRSFLWCDCSCRHRATPSGSNFAFAGSKSSELPLTPLCRLLCLYSASAGTCGWV